MLIKFKDIVAKYGKPKGIIHIGAHKMEEREDIDGIEDFDIWVKLLKKGYRFHNISSKLVLHRIHQESSFNTKQHDLKKIL